MQEAAAPATPRAIICCTGNSWRTCSRHKPQQAAMIATNVISRQICFATTAQRSTSISKNADVVTGHLLHELTANSMH
jgi:hypothetical protein